MPAPGPNKGLQYNKLILSQVQEPQQRKRTEFNKQKTSQVTA